MSRPFPPSPDGQDDGTDGGLAGAELDVYTVLFRESAVMMHAVDADGVVRDVSDKWLEVMGYERHEVLGQRSVEFLDPVSRHEVVEKHLPLVSERGYVSNLELRFRRKNGTPLDVLLSARLLRDRRGNFVRTLATLVDITERKRAEAALAEAVAELRRNAQLLEQTEKAARVGGWQVDLRTGELYLSDEVHRILGTTRDAFRVTRETATEFVLPEWRSVLEERVRTALARGEPFDVEFEIRDVEGQRVWIRCVGLADLAEGRPSRLYGSIQHVHERKQLEAQLLQAQRLESIGRLAGGVAHDFNNLLMSLLGFQELASMEVVPGSSVHRHLERIRDAALRGAGLTRQLLAFASRQVTRPRVVPLNDAVRRGIDLVRRLIGEDVELACELDPRAASVEIDPGQFEQVLMNLAVNARDAMPEGGRLTIATGEESIGEHETRELPPGRYARVTVADTGSGIPPDVLPHVFEPFFTTKPVGQGSGLGLSTCYGIVKQLGGCIAASNRTEGGAEFRILLPRVERSSDDAGDDEDFADEIGHETVLVVEDDESIRCLVAGALRRRGYVVLEAENGDEALRQAAPGIDLLVTDVVMPRMGGRELAAALRRHHPSLRVLYSSGYAEDPSIAGEPSSWFLQKPYTSRELAGKVREIFGRDERD
jgi:PAS domain S-box-containing protein